MGLWIAGAVFRVRLRRRYHRYDAARVPARVSFGPGIQGWIRVTIGLIATLAALVLGLLVASAKTAFDAQESGFRHLAANVVVLDRTLARYGPAAMMPARLYVAPSRPRPTRCGRHQDRRRLDWHRPQYRPKGGNSTRLSRRSRRPMMPSVLSSRRPCRLRLIWHARVGC